MINITLYQQFLVDYFATNSAEIKSLFYEPEASEVLSDALVATNWELDDASHLFGDESDEEQRLEDLESFQKKYGKHIKEFHRLALLNDKYCGQVVYLILESETGKLYMNEYVGD
jgi:hypothetical protein